MTIVNIDALPVGTAPTGTEPTPIWQGGEGVQVTTLEIAQTLLAAANSWTQSQTFEENVTVNGLLDAAQLEVAGVPVVDYPQTTQEAAADVTPVNYNWPELNAWRYGADPTGTNFSDTAFADLVSVMLQHGGASATIPPGTYKTANTWTWNNAPSSGPTAETHGMHFYARGVTLNYTGASYAIDVNATGSSATFSEPWLSFTGLNVECTASAAGGIRQRSISMARYRDVFVFGATAGPGFTVYNDQNWSENNRFEGCGVVNCLDGIDFITPTGSGTDSYARTHVDQFFGAGISRYWFWIQGGCSVYDSRFRHICGNFGSNAYFAIGTSSSSAADMTSTDIDGIYTEIDGTVTNQAVFVLLDYPQNSGVARRPKVANIGAYARYTGSGYIPDWVEVSSGSYVAVTVESAQTQDYNFDGPISTSWGQSQLYEPGFSVAAVTDVATTDSSLPTVAVTGCSAAVSGRMECNRSGYLAMVMAYDPLTGTSDADTMTLTGLPAEFCPTTIARSVKCVVEDNGVLVDAIASIATNGVITFSRATATSPPGYNSTGFTASGAKGLPAGTVIVYPLGA